MPTYNLTITRGNLGFLNGILTITTTPTQSIGYTLNSGVASTVNNPVFPTNNRFGFTLRTNNKNYRFQGATTDNGVSYQGNAVGPSPNGLTGGDEDDPWVATARVTEEELAVAAPGGRKPAKKKPAKKAAKKPAKKAARKPAKKAAKKPAKKAAKKPAKKAARKPVKKAAKKPMKKAAKKR